MDVNVDILLKETGNKPKLSHTHRSAKFEQGGKIIQDTVISGVREQILGKLEKRSCQGAYRLPVKDINPSAQYLSL